MWAETGPQAADLRPLTSRRPLRVALRPADAAARPDRAGLGRDSGTRNHMRCGCSSWGRPRARGSGAWRGKNVRRPRFCHRRGPAGVRGGVGGFPRDRGVSPPGRAPGRGTRGDPAAHTWPLARVQAESRLGPLDVPGRGTGDDPAEGRGRRHLRASHWCVQSPTGTAGLSRWAPAPWRQVP